MQPKKRILLLSDTHFGITEKTHGIWQRYWQNELEGLNPHLIILAGDIGTASLRHYEAGLRFFRTRTNVPILAVRGNHDLWDAKRKNIYSTIERTRALAEKWNIHLLQDHGPYSLGDIDFMGWDGWYSQDPSQFSNDFNWMPHFVPSQGQSGGESTHFFLSKRAHEGFEKVLEHVRESYNGNLFVVSHMPCVPGLGDGWRNAAQRYGDFLLQLRVPYMLFGHTHLRMDAQIGNTRVLSVGSDYNKPNHMLIEVEADSGSTETVRQGTVREE